MPRCVPRVINQGFEGKSKRGREQQRMWLGWTFNMGCTGNNQCRTLQTIKFTLPDLLSIGWSTVYKWKSTLNSYWPRFSAQIAGRWRMTHMAAYLLDIEDRMQISSDLNRLAFNTIIIRSWTSLSTTQILPYFLRRWSVSDVRYSTALFCRNFISWIWQQCRFQNYHHELYTM